MITRKGTWPILKYDLKGEHGWRASVFIDDAAGSIFVESDSLQFFGYKWPLQDKLREFLVSTSVGYINDKFSYGKDRWCADAAINDFFSLLELEFGHPNSWPTEIEELYEDELSQEMSKDAFYAILLRCDKLMEKIDPFEHSFGDIGANKYVVRFTEMFWEELVNYWKKELEDGCPDCKEESYEISDDQRE